MKKEICTAIVTYNRLYLLQDAIKSLRSQNQPTDILIVNNGSTDGTVEFLAKQKDLIIINQDNVGGAGGFYSALKYIAEHDYKFAWIMDDDIVAYPDSLSNIINGFNILSNDNKIGFLCSNVYSQDGETVNIPIVATTKNSTGYRDWNKYLGNGYVKVESATFVSVFIPVNIIKEIGLPIKEFFIWGDDTEYTRRISSKYSCFLIGSSKIQHLRNGGKLSLKTINDPKRIKMFSYYIRNNLYIEKTYGTIWTIIKFILSYIKQAFVFIICGNIVKTKVIIKGLIEGFFFHPDISFPEIHNRKDF